MKKLKPIILSAWVLLSASATVLAQSTTPAKEATKEAAKEVAKGALTPTFSLNELDKFIGYINTSITNLLANFLLPTAGGIIVIMIIWGGFQYMQGNPEAGKKTLTAAIIGLVIVALSFLIIKEIISIIGS